VIALEDGYHPLLDAPVKNSIRLAERSALVTGSNMAGKTTFIKMVGINVIFGRTLGFCFAKSASIPWSTVMASIRREHSVESGKSHYFAEIEAIHSFIENARRGDCHIFVIDELFNGTNTVERLAAVRAVLETLCQSAQVLVTTHDVELQDVLSDRYDLYHFQEDPDVEGFFDYRLRSGATRTRNAIRLLERMGFPSEIVRNAMLYAAGDVGRE
jgi:DNA mismatch repair ATPase MutS